MQTNLTRTYRFHHQGRTVTVPPSRAAVAQSIDKDGNGYLKNDEIAFYYGLPEESKFGNNRENRLFENKFHLAGIPNPVKDGYRSFADVEAGLKSLAKKYPDTCELKVLGKTAEGRPIYALRVTADAKKDSSNKVGVVFKGLEHAREWSTAEVVFDSAAKTLEKYAAGEEDYVRRLESAELWFSPVVNADGLEYSRNVDNTWRKNRAPVDTVVNGARIFEVGVDINRNYGDGSELGNLIFRPLGDKPNHWQDDFENGNDAPWSPVYRGEFGGSEAETDALQRLELGNPNIRGVLSYHSFGESFVYPPGYHKGDVEHGDLFRRLGGKMVEAAGGDMELKTSCGLYPISGSGLDIQYINGIVGMLVEINDCFQPDPAVLSSTSERFHGANMTFVDELLKESKEGNLPDRIVPDRYNMVK